MRTECHHCGVWADCSLQWVKKLDGALGEVKLICARCVFLYGYKFVAYVLGQK